MSELTRPIVGYDSVLTGVEFWRNIKISVYTIFNTQKSQSGHAKNSTTSPALKSVKFYFTCKHRWQHWINVWNYNLYFKHSLKNQPTIKSRELLFSVALHVIPEHFIGKDGTTKRYTNPLILYYRWTIVKSMKNTVTTTWLLSVGSSSGSGVRRCLAGASLTRKAGRRCSWRLSLGTSSPLYTFHNMTTSNDN